ncbi:SH3 domain-containing protein [Moritella sp.]|uniref:SH3 domain-containing protein n=1 Tax=Moritella sp. TaxID=78556 RepID=UPI001DE98251|nr:SH3 domain-containing protein [Moritella sp.]MCJ8351309.1 hypothetical protein [Moritella sp.]NQZ42361.1 hypothetical protein [Moritella sp.]
MRVVVKDAHKSNYPNPVCFCLGEELLLGHLDTEFAGWIRTTTKNGNQGRAPIDYIDMSKCKTIGIAKCDYNAFELDTSIGEYLAVLDELNEWFFVENDKAIKGWVPMRTVGVL